MKNGCKPKASVFLMVAIAIAISQGADALRDFRQAQGGNASTTPAAADDNIITSSNGRPCLTACDTASNWHYNWCQTAKTQEWPYKWDYCSPVPGVDYKHRACATPCINNGQDYKWCTLRGGDWGYCSTFTANQAEKLAYSISDSTIISSHGIPCKDECKKTRYYYWCTTARKINGYTWDYCAPTVGTDYRNRTCTSECAHSGKAYNWCYVKGGRWGYCKE